MNPCHTLDPLSPMSRQPAAYDMTIHYRTFQDYYAYCQGTAWQPRTVIRGQHRGFEVNGRPAQIVEQMAQLWDIFAQAMRRGSSVVFSRRESKSMLHQKTAGKLVANASDARTVACCRQKA